MVRGNKTCREEKIETQMSWILQRTEYKVFLQLFSFTRLMFLEMKGGKIVMTSLFDCL